jgi:hypothetical protein
MTAQAATSFSTVTSPDPESNYNEIDGLAAAVRGLAVGGLAG